MDVNASAGAFKLSAGLFGLIQDAIEQAESLLAFANSDQNRNPELANWAIDIIKNLEQQRTRARMAPWFTCQLKFPTVGDRITVCAGDLPAGPLQNEKR